MWHDYPWDSHAPSDNKILTSTGPIMAFNNETESIPYNVFNPTKSQLYNKTIKGFYRELI